jgi:hypothetical protein
MNNALTSFEWFVLYIVVTSAVAHVQWVKKAASKKKTTVRKPVAQQVEEPQPKQAKCAQTVENVYKERLITPKETKVRDRVVKVNEKAAQYYLMQKEIDRGMANLTSKYHKGSQAK